MFDFHEKRKIRKILYSKIFIGSIFIVAGFILISAYERFTIEREMALKLNDRTEELEAIEVRANTLGARVEHLKNDRGIEEELRKRFDVVKEGEQVVVIIDPETERVNTSSSSKSVPQKTVSNSFFEKIQFWKQ